MDKIGIVNIALVLIGAEKLTSLTDATKAARLANTLYEQARNEIFVWPIDPKKGWKFCTTRVQLAPNADNPAFGSYDHQYNIPANWLKILSTCDEDGDDKEYQFEREFYINANNVQYDVILTNEDEVYAKGIVLRTNEAIWPAWFCKLVILNLAIYLSEPLKQEGFRIPMNLTALFDKALNVAKTANAYEDVETTDDYVDKDKGNTDVVDAASDEGGIDAFENLI